MLDLWKNIPNTGVFGKFNPDCNLLEVEITDEQYTKLKQIVLEFKKEYQKYNYNYMGLVFTNQRRKAPCFSRGDIRRFSS